MGVSSATAVLATTSSADWWLLRGILATPQTVILLFDRSGQANTIGCSLGRRLAR